MSLAKGPACTISRCWSRQSLRHKRPRWGSLRLPTHFDIAAAHLFNLCRNHPFIDGNKRTALATCLVFLSEDSALPKEELDIDALDRLTMNLAGSHLTREQTATQLRALITGKPHCQKTREQTRQT
jgi:death on curing protein